nr:hypothetical protein Iba_chr08dCG4570 [Ipomoea batatas]
MYGRLAWLTNSNSACHKCGLFLDLLVMISTPLKPVGKLVQSYMEISTRDSSPIGRVMHTKRLGVTICCAQALFRLITELRLARRSHRHPRITVVNMTSAF